MYDLGPPLILALIAIQAQVMLDPAIRPALLCSGAATLMSVVAIVALLVVLPIPVSPQVALVGWAVAIFTTVMAYCAIRRRSALKARVQVPPDIYGPQ